MGKKVDKPVRLYVWTIFIVAAYGLWPLVSVYFVSRREIWLIGLHNLPFNGSVFTLADADGNYDVLLVAVSIFLQVFTSLGALWAFYGDFVGRVLALLFLTLDVVWWMGLILFAIFAADVAGLDKLSWGMELVGPPIWLGVIWWNFTRPDISAYYRYLESTSK